MTPHVCVVENNECFRGFLAATFQDLGFVVHPMAGDDPAAVATASECDLVAVSVSSDQNDLLERLATVCYRGKVLLIGGRHAHALAQAAALGTRLGLQMLPVLGTPFLDQDLESRVASLRPSRSPPIAPVDVDEALTNGWLEVWYQPKVDPRSLVISSAEALCRMRHPNWGIVQPSRFIPGLDDPRGQRLSEFVVARATADWAFFAQRWEPVEIAVNVPLAVLANGDFVQFLLDRCVPRLPGFAGLVVEVDASDIAGDVGAAKRLARTLRGHGIRLSIDDFGAEPAALAAVEDAPFAEIKVDQHLAQGCGADGLKRCSCRTIVDLARQFELRTVAEGIETNDDLDVARELGFDLIQGFVFAKPMERHKFARMLKTRTVAAGR